MACTFDSHHQIVPDGFRRANASGRCASRKGKCPANGSQHREVPIIQMGLQTIAAPLQDFLRSRGCAQSQEQLVESVEHIRHSALHSGDGPVESFLRGVQFVHH
jgi:hypothetical protein